METTVKDRLKQFIEYIGMNPYSFEKHCGLSTGYVGNMKQSIQPGKLKDISRKFPDLNTGWLLTGEGEMLKGGENIIRSGSNNTQVSGHGNTVSDAPAVIKALDEMAAQRELSDRLLTKSQEQIDRLLGIVENMQNTK